jgi:hypothetical protein
MRKQNGNLKPHVNKGGMRIDDTRSRNRLNPICLIKNVQFMSQTVKLMHYSG